jgi:DNA-binding Lrp family transcriptional regulator
VITAIVMVSCQPHRIPEVAEALSQVDGVSEVYSVTGNIDLIAIVRVPRHDALAGVIADKISKVDGVTGTDSHVAFQAYSRHDLEAAFSLGFEE